MEGLVGHSQTFTAAQLVRGNILVTAKPCVSFNNIRC